MLQKKPMFLTFFQKLVIIWKISMTNECKVFKCHLMHAQASVAHSYLRLMEIFKEIGKVDLSKMIVDSLTKIGNQVIFLIFSNKIKWKS